MTTYHPRRETVVAHQWTAENTEELLEWVRACLGGTRRDGSPIDEAFLTDFLHAEHQDFLVCTSRRTFLVLSPAEFSARYEETA